MQKIDRKTDKNFDIVFDIIIVGAGVAGLFAAANLSSEKKIIILEKNNSAGIKLLMSGGGKCNITDSGPISDFFTKYGKANKFLIPALKEFTNIDLINFLNSNGLHTTQIKDRIYPESLNSRDVLSFLLRLIANRKIPIYYNQKVIKVLRDEGLFQIETDSQKYITEKLVIATGGKSYPTSGSTGDGYDIAKAFGHTIIKPKPALTPIFVENYNFKEISGVSLENRKLSVYRNNKKIHSQIGDFSFTHWGLSGPGILDISRYVEVGDELKINFINMSPEQLKANIIDATKTNGKISLKKFIKTLHLPESLIDLLILELGISTIMNLSELNKIKRNEVIVNLCEYPFQIKRVGDFNVAYATAGGVSINEINPKTMESKLVNNLYFIGEVLDIDGDTGGYNIQAAFSTGLLASKFL